MFLIICRVEISTNNNKSSTQVLNKDLHDISVRVISPHWNESNHNISSSNPGCKMPYFIIVDNCNYFYYVPVICLF